MVTAHSILVIAYHILKHGTTYRELGPDYFDKRDAARIRERLIAAWKPSGCA